MKTGKIYLVISALAYGTAPVLAKMCYNGGANSITLAFLRSFLCLPIILIILVANKISLKLSKKELVYVLTAGIIGNSFMLLTLYAAYDFIPVGMATILHYIYPIITVFACRIFFKERLNKKVIFASFLVTVGIAIFSKMEQGNSLVGIALSLMSGLFYSFNLIYLDKTGLNGMNYMKLTFYFSLIMSIITFIFAILSKKLTFNLSCHAWFLAFVISVIVTFIALPCLQIGVRYVGAAETGIISTIEPLCSVLLSAVFLSEAVTIRGVIGGVMIILGVAIAKENKTYIN